MRKVILSCVISLILGLFGCTDVYDTPIPDMTDMTDAETAKVKKSLKGVPADDRKLLLRYIMRQAILKGFGKTDGMPEGTTIGEGIKEQRAFEAKKKKADTEESLIKEEEAAKRKLQVDGMNNLLVVVLLSKGVLAENYDADRYSKMITFQLALKNKTKKEVAGVKGTLVFKDSFGDTIKRVNFKSDTAIPSGGTGQWNGGMRYNQFMNSDQKLANIESDKLSLAFEPEVYLFSDGTKLTMSSPPEAFALLKL